MSNHVPPRACLADFGFMTMVLDPVQPLSCSAQLEGGTMTFMSPELLVPSKFGMKDSVPTPEGDIYAFGLVTFQVCEQDLGYRPLFYFVQVLTGEIPFRNVRQTELGWSVVQGLRPDKPTNASAIGFSDSLWGFVQRCWDSNMKLRPKVAEVVRYLEEAAANWDGLMPPYLPTENAASDLEEEVSDSKAHCESEISILPRYLSSSYGTGGLFEPSSGVPLTSPSVSETTTDSRLFDVSSTLSTQCSEPAQEEPQEVATKQQPVSRVPTRSRSEEQHDDAATYSHLDQHYDPPPSNLPQKKRKGFRHFKMKVREFFGFRR